MKFRLNIDSIKYVQYKFKCNHFISTQKKIIKIKCGISQQGKHNSRKMRFFATWDKIHLNCGFLQLGTKFT